MHAAGQPLAPGVHVRAVDLAAMLGRLRYLETKSPPAAPGQFQRRAGAWDIYLRGEAGAGPRRVRVEVKHERIAQVLAGLELSLNAATIRLAQQVGLDAVVANARALGIQSRPCPSRTAAGGRAIPPPSARRSTPTAPRCRCRPVSRRPSSPRPRRS